MARHDIEIYNEATGWVITSKYLAGYEPIVDIGPEWEAAIRDGVFVPLELVQDDPVLVRVVVDEPLTSTEAEEAVAHFSSRLRVEDGVFTLTGGTEYLEGEDADEYTRYVPIPAGDYKVDVYTYMPSLNGDYSLKSASKEPLGAYFRRTRPGEEFPAWLRNECIDDPSIDPGHEDEWPEDGEEDEEDAAYIMFLVHLTPVQNWNELDVAPLNDIGWVEIDTGARQPEKCPLGIIFEGKES